VRIYIKFYEDAWSSKSQEPPSMIEKLKELTSPKFDLHIFEKLNLDQQDFRDVGDDSLPLSLVRKPRWLT
jgi:hypothetical protein